MGTKVVENRNKSLGASVGQEGQITRLRQPNDRFCFIDWKMIPSPEGQLKNVPRLCKQFEHLSRSSLFFGLSMTHRRHRPPSPHVWSPRPSSTKEGPR
jgi:hypothetical protein